MSAHTPGPWTTNRSVRHPGGSIGTTRGAIAVLTEDRYPADEQTANAHVLAAAPEMLAALRAIVQAYDEGREPFANDVDRAREAIDTAEVRP